MQARLVLGSLLGAALGASACATHHVELADASISGANRSTGLAVTARANAPAASVPTDRYVEVSGRKAAPTLGTGFVQTTPDIWAPYDVQIHAGFFDPTQKATPQGVRICLEIDDVGFDVFYVVCGQHIAATSTWQTFAGTNLGNVAGVQNIVSEEIELRIEQRLEGMDEKIFFSARAAGAPDWIAISNTDYPEQLDPHKASFGASNITKGTAVGFDGLQATFSAPPVPPTGTVAVAADVNAALIASLDAQLALDAGLDDFATAGTALGVAEDALDDAQAVALPATKENQTAIKHMAKADKSLAKAQEQVVDQDSAKALKTLEKLGRSLIEAALLLNPQPFPPGP